MTSCMLRDIDDPFLHIAFVRVTVVDFLTVNRAAHGSSPLLTYQLRWWVGLSHSLAPPL